MGKGRGPYRVTPLVFRVGGIVSDRVPILLVRVGVGFLFIRFGRPRRLRVRVGGCGRLDGSVLLVGEHPLLDEYAVGLRLVLLFGHVHAFLVA